MLLCWLLGQPSICPRSNNSRPTSQAPTTTLTTHAMATQASGQISTNHTPAYYSPPFPPIDETAIFYSGLDFTPLNSASITRVASMSPEMSLKAELDLKKDGSNQHGPRNRPDSIDSTITPRHRTFPAPVDGVDLGMLNKKLETDVGTHRGTSKSPVNNKATHKPTAQEWVADIDCVSEIFGAMLADGDRGVIHL